MTPVEPGALRPYRFVGWSEQLTTGAQGARVVHGITRRCATLHRDGDMSFHTGGDADAVMATRRHWGKAIGFDPEQVVATRQVHGARVALVTRADRGRGARTPDDALPATDGLVTGERGVPLFLCFADCTPLLFHDPRRRAIGIAHAGWRGTVADIAGETVRAMSVHFESNPADLRVGIGPSIGPCCYVVGEAVATAWATTGIVDATVLRPDGTTGTQWRFDLPRANRLLLARAGVPPARITGGECCTACLVTDYFSHRAEAGRAGRFAAVIMLADGPHGGQAR